MERIEELLQRRSALVSEQRSLLDKAESEDRALTSEETQTYERRKTDIAGLETRVRALKDTREQERSIAEAEVRDSGVQNLYSKTVDPNEGSEERQYRAALNSYFRKGMGELSESERRDLVKGTNSAGGFLAPSTFRNTMITQLEEASAVRPWANVLTTSNGNPILMPKLVSPPVAEWVAEGGAKPEDDPVFDQVSLGAHKNALVVKVSWELLQDSAFDLEGYIAAELGRAIGRLEGAAYLSGASNSTTTPKGLFTSATAGVTAASTTVITSDEVISLIYSVSRPYRANARFITSDALIGSIMKLKTTAGDYAWQPSMQAGEPDRLFGYPVEVDTNVDGSPAANDVVLGFGDVRSYYIRDVDGITIQRLNELYAVNNFVGFLGEHRTDGALIDTNGFKTLKMAAA